MHELHIRFDALKVPSCSTVHRGAPRTVVRRVHAYATRILRVP
ncbi:unnamed protein product [Ectocarpus sp. 6 AP-2014]|uniref:Uncharacterized protein n=1 Tax=Ectocarpus siliculosus TaxID=2880 RepID=D7FKL8_ECTSI|nr:hypothetical protein Esi_0146_0034 [Ectocarpus siliculosus]|eukprot:CBJ29418.1 hypothetical protein Esi_0146_0034 [Ectocarpus siliculosus]